MRLRGRLALILTAISLGMALFATSWHLPDVSTAGKIGQEKVISYLNQGCISGATAKLVRIDQIKEKVEDGGEAEFYEADYAIFANSIEVGWIGVSIFEDIRVIGYIIHNIDIVANSVSCGDENGRKVR